MSEKVTRYDRGTFSKVQRNDVGALCVNARLTRSGVFTYSDGRGNTWGELRSPAEVFSPESLASFNLVPLTNDHPAEGAVTAENYKKITVGSVGDVRQDTEKKGFVSATLMVLDAAAVAAVESGKREISCGYYAEREPAPEGSFWVSDSGEKVPYKFVQKNIRGNHVAIVDTGRAGPQARILLDSEAIEVNQPEQQKARDMEKIVINGVTFEVSAQVSEALRAERKLVADSADLTAKIKSDLEKTTARADAAEAKCLKLDADLKVALAPASLEARIAERVALIERASKVGLKCDGLSNDQIKIAVVGKRYPTLKLDGKSADYVSALFDTVDNDPVSVIRDGDTSIGVPKKADLRADARNAFFNTQPAKQ